MQLVGTILWKVKTDYSRLLRCSSIVLLSILAVMTIIILPALASEAFATDPTASPQHGRATAVASARVIKPFAMTPRVQNETKAQVSAITVTRRTTFRNCEILLGADANSGSGEACELRLIELH
ncbi:MAG: hypothetical protein V7679_00360 [Parasphingorhabdus sp.]